jgi:N utilization substance protein B
MRRERRAREAALQIAFELEFNDSDPQKIFDQYWREQKAVSDIQSVREYSDWLVKGALSHRPEIDVLIQSCSEHWRIVRMAYVDRNILRLAVFELLHEKEVAPAIIINEAIEIAKKFSGEKAATFINGILDAVREKIESAPGALREGKNGQTRKTQRKRKPTPKPRDEGQ